ncbi:unnamed protein product [Bemisia tabaci]|uniref:Uncharacterized protein n=1 Tax=Bemisia tabaci TaxID=7038 RepID=A0A9P0A479_BEMTA|nr:unnamed protein product [Bemisia tabaci]
MSWRRSISLLLLLTVLFEHVSSLPAISRADGNVKSDVLAQVSLHWTATGVERWGTDVVEEAATIDYQAADENQEANLVEHQAPHVDDTATGAERQAPDVDDKVTGVGRHVPQVEDEATGPVHRAPHVEIEATVAEHPASMEVAAARLVPRGCGFLNFGRSRRSRNRRARTPSPIRTPLPSSPVNRSPNRPSGGSSLPTFENNARGNNARGNLVFRNAGSGSNNMGTWQPQVQGCW